MYSGGTPKTSNKNYYGGNIPFIKSGEINNTTTSQCLTEIGIKESSAKKVNKGDLLFALYGATSGEVAISKIDGAINQAVLKIDNNMNKVFQYNYFIKRKSQIIRKYIQGGQGNLSAKIIKNLEFYYPTLNEQEKIANFLSVVDKKIELMERKHKLIKKYKNGLMHEIFTQNIKFSNNELGLFKLGEIVELMRNGSNEVQVNFETEFPVTRIETISKGNINFDKVGFVETIDKSYQLKKGDILLSNINSLKYIGNCVYFDMDKILYHGMNLMLIRFKENFNKKFLYYYIKYHKNWFQRMACQAVNQASINQTSLKKFPFIIPKLKTDQDKIADFLSEMDNKIDFVEQQLEKIKEFKKYLLQQMFI